jgi:UDP-glucose 4-epimerase
MLKETLSVVTGGAGFIGSHLVRSLLRRGGRTRIIDSFLTGKEENIADILELYGDQCTVIREDIREEGVLREAFDGADAVFHQAAITSVQRSVDDPVETNSVNVGGTVKVLWAARQAGVRKVIFATSTAVYGNSPELPKREDMHPDPMSPYAASKYAGEMFSAIFSEIYGLDTVGLRYFNVFGPHQDPRSEYAAVIPRFITRMLAGERPVIYGDGEQSRDFVFVEDVVAANLAAADSEVKRAIINIWTGESWTLNRLVENLNEILRSNLEPVYEPPRQGEVRHSEADVSLAGKSIGFTPAIPFAEGLRRTVEWFQKRALGEGH